MLTLILGENADMFSVNRLSESDSVRWTPSHGLPVAFKEANFSGKASEDKQKKKSR